MNDPPRWGRADGWALMVWTIAATVAMADAMLFGRALFYFDITEINYPYRAFLAREMQLGRLSRWCPDLYCGLPLYSESQAGYWHPIKWLFYPWMPTWRAFNWDVFLSIWLTGVGTYGWLRRRVGVIGALSGAAVAGLGGYTWAHFVHTSMINALASVPFALWSLEWGWDRRRWAGAAGAALALACQVFAGHLQDVLLTAGLLGMYALLRAATGRGERKFVLGSACAAVVVGVLLAAVQWLPSKELLDRSPRAGGLSWDELTYGSWHPELLPTLWLREAYGTRARDTDWMDGFYPYHEMNAYVGLTAAGLALLGASLWRQRFAGTWLTIAVVAAVLMLGRFTAVMDQAYRIPIAGSSRVPVRFDLWLTFAVAALAALGADRLARGGAPVRWRWVAIVLGVVVLVSVPILLWVYAPIWTTPLRWRDPYHFERFRWLAQELIESTVRTGVLGLIGLIALRQSARGGRPRWAAVLPIVVLTDLVASHRHDAATVDPAYWTAPPPAVAALRQESTFSRMHGVSRKSSGEPGYASLAAEGKPIDFLGLRDPLDWSLPLVWSLATNGGETPMVDRRRKQFTDVAHAGPWGFELESVSHVLVDFERPGWRKVGNAWMTALDDVRPRVEVLGRPRYAADAADAARLFAALGPEAKRHVIVEDPDRPLAESAEAMGSATIVIDEPERVVVRANVVAPGYLLLRDTFDPGWSARSDGREVPVRAANVAFRAVFLMAGDHEVIFRYRPVGFLPGLGLSAVGGMLLVLMIVWRRGGEITPVGGTSWPRGWPWVLALGVVVLVAGSAVGSARWHQSWHRFTWDTGIEAMQAQAAGGVPRPAP